MTRARKVSEVIAVIAVYRWVPAVGPTVLKFGRQPTVSALGLPGIVLHSRVDATDGRSISLDDPIKYSLRFWEMSSTGQQNSADFREFRRISGL